MWNIELLADLSNNSDEQHYKTAVSPPVDVYLTCPQKPQTSSLSFLIFLERSTGDALCTQYSYLFRRQNAAEPCAHLQHILISTQGLWGKEESRRGEGGGYIPSPPNTSRHSAPSGLLTATVSRPSEPLRRDTGLFNALQIALSGLDRVITALDLFTTPVGWRA
jgi:hypothetical protein